MRVCRKLALGVLALGMCVWLFGCCHDVEVEYQATAELNVSSTGSPTQTDSTSCMRRLCAH